MVALFLQPAQRVESFSRHYVAPPAARFQAVEVRATAKTF
jgi:hypothetical protein